MEEEAGDAVARVGELLFGRALRLRVALWVATRDDPVFFQGEAARGVDYSASAVIQELERLERLGMVTRLPRTAGDRRQYYARAENRLWDVVAAAGRAIAAPPPAASG